jgi:hypothetical protein
MRLIRRDSSERTHVDQDMTSMYMYMEVLELTSVERSLLLLNLSKVSQVDPDSSLRFQLTPDFTAAQQLSPT